MTPSEAALGVLPPADFPGDRFDKIRTEIASLFRRAFDAGIARGKGPGSEDPEKIALAHRVLALHRLVEEVKKLLDNHCVYPTELKSALEEAEAKDPTMKEATA